MVGWSDPPADLGDTRAIARLSGFLPARAPVVSSDLQRARATADAIAGPRPRLADNPALREINFGAWELMSYDQADAADPGLIRDYLDTPGDIAPPGGESWNDIRARVNPAVDTLIDAHSGRDLIVVAHFGVILTQLQRAKGLNAVEAFAHKIDNLSVTRITCDTEWDVDLINHIP